METPWKHIITSVPLWAIFISHLGQNWGYWTLLTEMPNYINSVLGVDIKKVNSEEIMYFTYRSPIKVHIVE